MDRWAERALTEWRGFAPPVPLDARLQRVGSVLGMLLPRLGLAEAVDEAEVRRVWASLVGEFIAGHTEPARFTRGVLTVKVLQPTIRFELERNWKPRITARLQEHFGSAKVRGLRFVS